MLNNASKKKKWNKINCDFDFDAVHHISTDLNLSFSTSKLLFKRGYDTPEKVTDFIYKKTELLYNPMLLKDMDKAVERVLSAINNKEKILIYGDYDVDGVTSVSILYSYLVKKGVFVKYFIPNRIGDGYGVNLDTLKSFSDDGYTLVITVDTGITATNEVECAKEFGLDIVITDHHECISELPCAVAVVNPKRPDCQYPFKELAGCGVAFKLICALEMRINNCNFSNAIRNVSAYTAEFVAIGTIADVMPLVDENRIIVSYGLSLLEKSQNIGLRALMKASGILHSDGDVPSFKKKITASTIGFTIAPRLNAAGRISSAEISVELLLTNDLLRAEQISAELCEINRIRQSEENAIIESADSKISEQCKDDDYIIVLNDDHWHHGVIGIVCSRLTEKYNLPSILISFEHNMSESPEKSDIGKGSGRSIQGLNLFDALEASSDLLLKYGGHELAAGLSIKRGNLEEFRNTINSYAKRILDGKELCRTINIDTLLSPEDINVKFASELYYLEPFGAGNATPVFETDRLILTEVTAISGGKHTKITLSDTSFRTFTGLLFGTPTSEFEFRCGDVVDIAYNLDINDFRGKKSVQLLIKDIIHSHCSKTPVRDDFVNLYKILKDNITKQFKYSIDELKKLCNVSEEQIYIMLDVFSELSIIKVNYQEKIEIILLPVTAKIPLENSRILRSLIEYKK